LGGNGTQRKERPNKTGQRLHGALDKKPMARKKNVSGGTRIAKRKRKSSAEPLINPKQN